MGKFILAIIMQISSSVLRGMAKLIKTLIFYSSLCKHGTHLILHYYHGNYFLNYFLTSVTTILNFNLPAPLRQGQIVRLF